MKNDQVNELLKPVVTGLGYEYVGCERIGQDHSLVLRVYADKPGGISLDDCGVISQQLGAVLDVEDVFAHRYRLEVSSPGIERPLFEREHFKDAIGKTIKVRTLPVDGRSNFRGILIAINEDDFTMDVDSENISIPFTDVLKARTIYIFESKQKPNTKGKKRRKT